MQQKESSREERSRELPRDLTPPHSVEAEKAVLGALLTDPDSLVIVEGILRPEHFFLDAHQKIYTSAIELSASNESVDVLTVSEKLRFAEGDAEYLGPAYLVELMESCPVTQNVEHYAEIVRGHAYMRRIIGACQKTIRDAYANRVSIDSVEKEFLAITAEHDRAGIKLSDSILEATLDEIQKRMDNENKVNGVPSGFTELDALTGGFQGSHLLIIAARPGMGKTAIALNLAFNAAKHGKSVAVFTLEMDEKQLMTRILSSESRVDYSRLIRGDMTEDEVDRMMEGARTIYQHHKCLGIDETPGVSLMELRSRCRRWQKEKGLDMVIIDYLQLMGNVGANNKKMESREREIAEISKGLKILARELNIPVIALAQLNRGPDSRPDKRPKLTDLRESGSMEQDADIIMFVYRDEYYNPTSENAGVAELIIAKNRHGATKTVKIAYQPNFVSFQNLYLEPAPQSLQ